MMNPTNLSNTILRLNVSLLLLAGLFTSSAETSGPRLDRTIKQGKDQFELTYQLTLPALKSPALLYLPLAKSDSFQTVKIKQIQSPTAWQLVRDKDHGNLALSLNPSLEHSGQTIEICYQVTRREKPIYRTDLTESEIQKYLQPDRLVPRKKTFTDLAQSATHDASSDMDKGRALYRHTLERMRYDKSGLGWGRGDAIYACDSRTGNCTDFHAYFIALCRSLGIPARFAIGFTIPADQNEGTIGGYHCWAEFLADDQWIPVDISEADKHPELAEYYFGHHPANRLEMTVGRDLVFDLANQTEPLNFLVYPHLQAENHLLRPETKYTFRRIN